MRRQARLPYGNEQAAIRRTGTYGDTPMLSFNSNEDG
jgi:hypothetical protein